MRRARGLRARTTSPVRWVERAGTLMARRPPGVGGLIAPLAGRMPRGRALVTVPLRRPRGPRALAALLAGFAVAVVIAITVGIGGSGHPARPAAGAAVLPGTQTRAARWLAGPAGRMLGVVSADLGRLTVAELSGKPGRARLAGQRLSRDARTALLGPPPPRAARLYRAALTDLERAGRSAATGRFRAAAASLRAGESTITRVTAIANAPAAAGPASGAVREPAGE